jgi:hypothetical protein
MIWKKGSFQAGADGKIGKGVAGEDRFARMGERVSGTTLLSIEE